MNSDVKSIFILSSLEKADAAFNSGNYEKAISLFDEILSEHPDEVAALFGKAQVLYYLRKDNESLDIFLKILPMVDKLDMDSYIQTLLLVSQIMRRMGKDDEAIQYIEMVLEIDPNNQYAKGYKVMIEKCLPVGI